MVLGILPSETLNKVVVHKNIFIDMVKRGERTVLKPIPSVVRTQHTSVICFLEGKKKMKSNWKAKLKF